MLLELKDVTKRYRMGGGAVSPPVLEGLNLQLAAGATLAIVGPSGCGKSTLLNLVGALDRPSAGSILLDGRELSAMSEPQLAQLRAVSIGFVFQMHHLLPHCSVMENVLVPALAAGQVNEQARQRARRLLEAVGLADKADHRPSQLSAGQCQRIAAVRAMINRPRLLLADEPTGSLDRQAAASMAELLLQLNRQEGVAILLATHSMELAARMAGVVELRDGRLEALARQ